MPATSRLVPALLIVILCCAPAAWAAALQPVYQGQMPMQTHQHDYGFTLTQDGVVTLSADFVVTGGPYHDVRFGILDVNGEVIDYGFAAESTVVVDTPLAPGDYAVYVYTWRNDTVVDYTITTGFDIAQPDYNEQEINDDYDRVQALTGSAIYGTLGHFRKNPNPYETDDQDRADFFTYTAPPYPGLLTLAIQSAATLASQATHVTVLDSQKTSFGTTTLYSTDETGYYRINQGGRGYYIVGALGLFDRYGFYDAILTYTPVNPDYNETEPNNEMQQAQAFPAGAVLQGALGCYDEGFLLDNADWHSFALGRETTMVFSLAMDDTLYGSTTHAGIFDAAGDPVKQYTMYDPTLEDTLTLGAGTYFLVVSTGSSNSYGGYTATLGFPAPGAALPVYLLLLGR